MITLFGGPTPNARKIAIALEELELPWRLEPIDMLRGDQLKPEFLALNPNNKSPVIIDDEGPDTSPHGGFVLWESGAILWYLAEKTSRLLPLAPGPRAVCHQWLMFQVSGVGPTFGQNAHFQFYAKERHSYAMERYSNEVNRLLRVLEKRLGEARWLAGDQYTIADIATYPFLLRQLTEKQGRFPELERWAAGIGARPAVQRGMAVGREHLRSETIEGGLTGLSDEQRSVLFGPKQYGMP